MTAEKMTSFDFSPPPFFFLGVGGACVELRTGRRSWGSGTRSWRGFFFSPFFGESCMCKVDKGREQIVKLEVDRVVRKAERRSRSSTAFLVITVKQCKIKQLLAERKG
jgi:hypothetical protein